MPAIVFNGGHLFVTIVIVVILWAALQKKGN